MGSEEIWENYCIDEARWNRKEEILDLWYHNYVREVLPFYGHVLCLQHSSAAGFSPPLPLLFSFLWLNSDANPTGNRTRRRAGRRWRRKRNVGKEQVKFACEKPKKKKKPNIPSFLPTSVLFLFLNFYFFQSWELKHGIGSSALHVEFICELKWNICIRKLLIQKTKNTCETKINKHSNY